jgi:hypothetical protein
LFAGAAKQGTGVTVPGQQKRWRFQPNAKLIREFVSQYFDKTQENHNSRGQWLNVESPFREGDKRLCLGFNLDDHFVHDFYTGDTKSFVGFVKDFLELPKYEDTILFLVGLAKECGAFADGMIGMEDIQLTPPPPQIPQRYQVPLTSYPPASVPLNYALEDPFIQPALNYLKPRVSQEDIDERGLRYCLVGKYARRIIIPVKDEDGRFVWFQGRTIEKDREPKYLNPEGEHKSQLVYGLDRKKPGDIIVLCEGVFDVIKIDGCCTFGKSVNLLQLAKIKERGHKQIVLAYDGDVAGIDGTLKTAPLLVQEGFDCSVVLFPHGVKDFGEMTKNAAFETIENAIPWQGNEKWLMSVLAVLAIQAAKETFEKDAEKAALASL